MFNHKIVIAAGGTGGHVFPALCVAEEFKKNKYEVEIITDKRGKRYIKDKANIYNIYTKNRFLLYFSILINCVKILFKFLINRPTCVISFGGYPSVAPVFVAQILRIKTCIHEQNAIAGKANKLLSNFASLILVSFENTAGIKGPTIVVGNPIRFNQNIALTSYTELKTILIFGGSQGAKIFNDIVPIICKLKADLCVFHQARKEDIEDIKKQYFMANIKCHVADFFKNIDELYKKADLVIARSGASTIFELIEFSKPAILLPYEYSKSGDQIANANYLKKYNAAIVISTDNGAKIAMEQVELYIKDLIKNPNKLNNFAINISELKISNSALRFFKAVEELLT